MLGVLLSHRLEVLVGGSDNESASSTVAYTDIKKKCKYKSPLENYGNRTHGIDLFSFGLLVERREPFWFVGSKESEFHLGFRAEARLVPSRTSVMGRFPSAPQMSLRIP